MLKIRVWPGMRFIYKGNIVFVRDRLDVKVRVLFPNGDVKEVDYSDLEPIDAKAARSRRGNG